MRADAHPRARVRIPLALNAREQRVRLQGRPHAGCVGYGCCGGARKGVPQSHGCTSTMKCATGAKVVCNRKSVTDAAKRAARRALRRLLGASSCQRTQHYTHAGPGRHMARFASWLANLSDSDIAYFGGTLLALLIVLTAGVVLLVRSCTTPGGGGYRSSRVQDSGPAYAEEYDMLQVIVVAHDQEAELEVQTDAWNSYEELRELVVDVCCTQRRTLIPCCRVS